MRGLWVASLTLLALAPADAGELIFANGSRLAGELSNESLMVSTGSGLVELTADEVQSLSRDEITLRDGRVIRGTLVGGQVKARTALGEIAVKVDELQSYRAGESGAAPAQAAAPQPAAPASGPGGAVAPASPGVARSEAPISGGLPTMAAYQPQSAPRPGNGAAPPADAPRTAVPTSGRILEIVDASALHRDAMAGSSQIGRVSAGQQVRYLDSIDRRLRILNLLVFDGGYWIKVRVADGTEGWVPADNVREVR